MNPNVNWPAASTVGQILSRARLTNRTRRSGVRRQDRSRLDSHGAPSALAHGLQGVFLTATGTAAIPFTITDAHSRLPDPLPGSGPHGSGTSKCSL